MKTLKDFLEKEGEAALLGMLKSTTVYFKFQGEYKSTPLRLVNNWAGYSVKVAGLGEIGIGSCYLDNPDKE